MSRLSTEERQEQIISEAIEIIHKRGFSKLGIRALAKKVGISEPAIYRHFASKDEIIVGILNHLLRMGNMLEKHLGGFETAKERIRQFMLFHFDFMEKNPQITSVVFSENLFQPNSSLKSKLQEIVTSRYRILNTLIEEAKQEGTISDANTEDLTVLMIGNIRMIVLEWRLSDFGFALKRRGNRAWLTLERLVFVS